MEDFDFEPPSFSLGLDFDLDSDPGPASGPNLSSGRATLPCTTSNLPSIEEEDDDFDWQAEAPDSTPPRSHKRLRRGPKIVDEKMKPNKNTFCNVDDEIEDFSSEEDCPPGDLQKTHSVCSSSKFLFRRPGVLKPHLSNEQKSKKKESSIASASMDGEKGASKYVFPKFPISPLRKFQLIDSDSDDDDPSAIEDGSKEANHSSSRLKNSQSDHNHHEDLWKDFCSEKSVHIPTPAFDEVCKEYFGSVNDKSHNHFKDSPQFFSEDNVQQRDMASLPPSYHYFFHEDPRIQKLVYDRLPHFFPLGAGNSQGYRQQNASVIDYMGQFSQGDSSKQTTRNQNAGTSSTRRQKNLKKSSAGKLSRESENWVNPKSCAEIPKDAGKRRVHAVSKSAGCWFTGADGQRVYVNKKGQELRGQVAYRQYKKESGLGFKNSNKKKSTANKKTACKKK